VVDIFAGMEQDERAMERIASAMERQAGALESLAGTLVSWYKIDVQRLAHEFPAKSEPRESTYSRLPTTEDKLRAAQGETNQTTEEWMQLGPREREFVEKAKIAPREASKK